VPTSKKPFSSYPHVPSPCCLDPAAAIAAVVAVLPMVYMGPAMIAETADAASASQAEHMSNLTRHPRPSQTGNGSMQDRRVPVRNRLLGRSGVLG
jgi:hypothetical protein